MTTGFLVWSHVSKLLMVDMVIDKQVQALDEHISWLYWFYDSKIHINPSEFGSHAFCGGPRVV